MKKSKHLPFSFLDNIFSKARIERGWTIEELGKKCGLTKARTGAILSGNAMPTDYEAQTICNLLGIDFNEGQLEFQHIHRACKSGKNSGRDKIVHSAKADKLEKDRAKAAAKKAKRDAEKAKYKQTAEELKQAKAIIKAYEKPVIPIIIEQTPWSEPTKAVDTTPATSNENIKVAVTINKDKILKLIYNQVDYATFNEVANLLDGKE